MRKTISYRILCNGYEYHRIEQFSGEFVGMYDINKKPIYEGDKVKAYDEMLKETIKGVITYVVPSFCISCKGYNQPLNNVSNIEIIK